MADLRTKYVLHELADLYSRKNFAMDKMTNLSEPLKKGDSIEVPSIGGLTVYADGASSQTAQSVNNAALTLTVDRHPWMPIQIPAVAEFQNMDGTWVPQVTRQATLQMLNKIDEQLLSYCAFTLAYDGNGTYHDNVAGDSLELKDILNAKAALTSMDGVAPQTLALFVSTWAEASILNIPGFTLNTNTAERGELGIPFLGKVAGIQVYTSNSIPRSSTVATSAVTVATNVATATVPAGHGIEPGTKIKNSGLSDSASNTTAATVTSVTATTIVFPFTASNGAQSDGVGLLTIDSSLNLLIDTAQVFVAQQSLPEVRTVPDPTTTGDILQISRLWGRVGRPGHVRVIHSPASAI